jgi:hypothetical protein
MKSAWLRYRLYIGMISLAAVLAASSAFATKNQTFVGTVGDAVCGAKHAMDGDEISCLRTCVRRGSKYDLVVGEKVYVLDIDSKDKSSADALDKLAGRQVKVKGEASGDTIEVQSVAAAELNR